MSLPHSFVVIVFCSLSSFCNCTDTISSTQLIKDPETIVSQNGTFRLGFFSPPNSTNRYFGVIFNNPVNVTNPAWVANRDKPLTDSLGSVKISEDGNLVVLDGQKQVIWTSNVSYSMRNSTARILDTGNLILQDSSSGERLWESFQHISNSYLQGMELSTDLKTGKNNMLVSWRSPSNPSTGSFTLGVRPLNLPEILIWNGTHPSWRSGPWNGQVFLGISSMTPIYLVGGFTFVDDRQGSASLSFAYTYVGIQIYYHLSSEGVLTEMYWAEGLQDWEISWSNKDDCYVYGKCGPFGICDSQKSPICSCLDGYDPLNLGEWSRGNWSSGCVRRRKLQCQENGTDQSKQDGFLKFQSVKVPDFAQMGFETDDCQSQCLRNCSCIAYSVSNGIGCMQWTGDLIDIMKLNGTHVADFYVRVAYTELDKKKSKKVVVTIAVILASIGIAIGACLSWICISRIRGRRQKQELLLSKRKGAASSEQSSTEIMLGSTMNHFEETHVFDFQQLTAATANFGMANKLGQGGFGPVYKGKLPDGHEIAVKRLSSSSGQGLEEFMNEVLVISKLQHRNLVRLLGCCVEKEEKILIYEFMPNGSLDSLLFDQAKQGHLDWSKRVDIIEGIARGLLYLHRDSRLRIIHRDLKASNILLDEKLNPKISDFGMARIVGSDQVQENTRRVVGTYGYMSPEYAMEGRFSEKSDVYSFGVLLLEIISGRRNSSFYYDENFSSLLRFAWNLWNERKITELIDYKIRDPHVEPEILKHIHMGLLCVQEFAKDRPTVSTVLSMLSSERPELPTPKQPAFTERPMNSSETDTRSSRKIDQKYSVNNASFSLVEGR